jgi:hypothetical protein
MTDNIGFAGINYQWFIGQVPPDQILDKTDPNGWGDRVKVRIVGIHDKSGVTIPDEKLPWAIVERPTSQGNASRGSTGLTGGEWVRGYFLDPFNQVPVITSVLARGTYENNVSLEIVKERKSTEFQNVTRYNSFSPYAGQRLGSEKPKLSESAALDPTLKNDVAKAKENATVQPQEVTNSPPVSDGDPLAFEEFTGDEVSPASSGGGSSGSTTQTAADVLNRDPQSISQYGTRINNTPTVEQLEQFKSSGLTFTPNADGSPGGKVNNPNSLLGG